MRRLRIILMIVAVSWLIGLAGCEYVQAIIDPAGADPEIVDRTVEILEGVTTIAPVIAPWTGPAAPVILIITNLLTGVLTRIRARRTAVVAVAAPLNAARDRKLEEDLAKTNPGKKFMVIDQRKANSGHVAANVDKLIP